MTGFGRAEAKRPEGLIRVEVKTTNHKFLEISSKFPPHLMEFEESARKVISQNIRRGKVNLFVSSPDPAAGKSRFELNETLAKELFAEIKKLNRVLKAELAEKDLKRLAMTQILRNPDVWVKISANGRTDSFFKDLTRALNAALANLDKSRLFEGRALEKDFVMRLSEIEKSLKVIEKRIPLVLAEYKKNLEKRMQEFIRDNEIDRERLTVEVAQYSKGADISEEVTRLKSHLGGMRQALKESGELGRKIDFIGQEMYREANTMGAKSNDVMIANHVIQIKSSIEKIREQSQNVE